MRNAWDNAHRKYLDNLNEVLLVGNIYKSLVCMAPLFSEDLTDLLRVQLVNTLSAFDHLIHEYVRVGLEKQLIGEHPPTAKTGTFTLDIDRYLKLSKLGSSPNEILQKHQVLSSRVDSVLRTLTFQSPEKIKDALSYIWEEPHKWQVLSQEMNLSEKVLTQKVQLYVERRNQIVHEADYDRISHRRRPLSPQIVEECINLYRGLAQAINTHLV